MTILLDGKALATKLLIDLANKVSELETKPKLAVIIVGENPASKIYVALKEKRAKAIGMESLVIPLSEDITQEALLEHIDILNEDASINAILVQMPLPRHINKEQVISRILPQKDVDGFHPLNAGLLTTGGNPYATPCTPTGIIKLLNEYKIEIAGKHVVIIGRSNIVGKPMAEMFLARNATVTVCHSKTENLQNYIKNADIIVSASGVPKLVKGDLIKPNAVVIDVGISKDENGKLVGDVDFETAQYFAGAITPNPGGVGPMTIAMLLYNTYKLYAQQKLN